MLSSHFLFGLPRRRLPSGSRQKFYIYSLSPFLIHIHILLDFTILAMLYPPQGLPPYWGEEVCASWRERKLLIEPPGQRIGSRRSIIPGPPGWVLAMGLSTPPRTNSLLRNHGGGQVPHTFVAPVKKKSIGI
jgi:hypothetical protein